jgi:hypothetical protein
MTNFFPPERWNLYPPERQALLNPETLGLWPQKKRPTFVGRFF